MIRLFIFSFSLGIIGCICLASANNQFPPFTEFIAAVQRTDSNSQATNRDLPPDRQKPTQNFGVLEFEALQELSEDLPSRILSRGYSDQQGDSLAGLFSQEQGQSYGTSRSYSQDQGTTGNFQSDSGNQSSRASYGSSSGSGGSSSGTGGLSGGSGGGGGSNAGNGGGQLPLLALLQPASGGTPGSTDPSPDPGVDPKPSPPELSNLPSSNPDNGPTNSPLVDSPQSLGGPDDNGGSGNDDPVATPEPGTLILGGLGLIGLARARRNRAKCS